MRKMAWPAMLVLSVLAIAPVSVWPADAHPANCPPNCDRIPVSAWIDSANIPLYPFYRWPGLAGLSVTATAPRFKFEEACASTPVFRDPRDYAVAARATVVNPDGQWQLHAQVLHWRGETGPGGQIVTTVFQNAVAALRTCQLTSPLTSPSVTTDEPARMAAVISRFVPGQVIHEYLLADPRSSTIVELALWATTPPLVDWAQVPDAQVLDAMATPLCNAYIGSCR
jgi:hypothetical protein